jgi:hypothetical protein
MSIALSRPHITMHYNYGELPIKLLCNPTSSDNSIKQQVFGPLRLFLIIMIPDLTSWTHI